MGIHQPRQDRRGPVVASLDGRAVSHVDVARPTEVGDPIAVDQKRRLLHGGRAGAVEETGRRNQREACGGLGHSVPGEYHAPMLTPSIR